MNDGLTSSYTNMTRMRSADEGNLEYGKEKKKCEIDFEPLRMKWKMLCLWNMIRTLWRDDDDDDIEASKSNSKQICHHIWEDSKAPWAGKSGFYFLFSDIKSSTLTYQITNTRQSLRIVSTMTLQISSSSLSIISPRVERISARNIFSDWKSWKMTRQIPPRSSNRRKTPHISPKWDSSPIDEVWFNYNVHQHSFSRYTQKKRVEFKAVINICWINFDLSMPLTQTYWFLSALSSTLSNENEKTYVLVGE